MDADSLSLSLSPGRFVYGSFNIYVPVSEFWCLLKFMSYPRKHVFGILMNLKGQNLTLVFLGALIFLMYSKFVSMRKIKIKEVVFTALNYSVYCLLNIYIYF